MDETRSSAHVPGISVFVPGMKYLMTLVSVKDGHALCSWFEDEHSPREADFSVDSLSTFVEPYPVSDPVAAVADPLLVKPKMKKAE